MAPILGSALVNSAKLAIFALILIIPLGILGGVIAALNVGRALDRGISLTGLSAATVPEFVSGIVVIVIFGVGLKILPSSATCRARRVVPDPAEVPDPAGHPAGLRVLRLHRPDHAGGHDRGARVRLRPDRDAQGPAARVVIRRHVLRNSLLPTITVIATQIGYLLGGLVVVETLFNYHGIGC